MKHTDSTERNKVGFKLFKDETIKTMNCVFILVSFFDSRFHLQVLGLIKQTIIRSLQPDTESLNP